MKHTPLALFILATLLAPTIHAGPLTPPGAPAPTMVTLDQLNTAIDAQEPRIDILTLPGDTTNSRIISASGSYYLSGNLVGESGKDGISVGGAVTDVSIDLNGFAVIGVAGSGTGIIMEATTTNYSVKVCNGFVRSWSVGVSNNGSGTASGELLGLEVSQCGTGYALSTGRWILSNCSARSNTLNGFNLGNAAIVSSCVANSNGQDGFSTGLRATMTNCTSDSNTQIGFAIGAGSSLSHCLATGNSTIGFSSGTSVFKSCVAIGSANHGFQAFDSHFESCSAIANGLDGFRSTGSSTIRGCTAQSNGATGVGAGIHATGADNRIEGNNVLLNDNGIDCDIVGNVVIGNSASGNTDNYGQVVAGNFLGTVATTPATMNAATNPFINISY